MKVDPQHPQSYADTKQWILDAAAERQVYFMAMTSSANIDRNHRF